MDQHFLKGPHLNTTTMVIKLREDMQAAAGNVLNTAPEVWVWWDQSLRAHEQGDALLSVPCLLLSLQLSSGP